MKKTSAGLGYYWRAQQYCGGDGPIVLMFKEKEWRDEFVKQNDYCNKLGKIREDHIYDEGGNHFGIFVKMTKEGKFVDVETGIEI